MKRHGDEVEQMRTGTDLGPLFQAPPVKHLARVDDPATAKQAAVDIQDHLPELQRKVWLAYVEHGPMTPKECDQLPEFQGYGFSTIRRRCSDLKQWGYLKPTGIVRAGSAELQATTAGERQQEGAA